VAGDYVIGIDVGTGGARAVAVDARGRVLASAQGSLPPTVSARAGWAEQEPEDWWRVLGGVTRECFGAASRSGGAPAAVCVDSTSGTVVAVNEAGLPARPAIMYNDARSSAEAEELNVAGADVARKMGYRFNASYSLPKALWLLRHDAARCAGTRFLSPAEHLGERLCGVAAADETNALKMGYDLIDGRWPEWPAAVGIDRARLPRVCRSGEIIGAVTPAAAAETGLPEGLPVAAGPTDGVAGFYAAGAVQPGEAATTLGTTLVVKSVSRGIVRDPAGRIYCHRHAEGHWLPGGASNCGCDYATVHFGGASLDALTAAARGFLPSEKFCYPLPRRGERFPVVHPQAESFLSTAPRDAAEHFAMYLQGVAFVERWAYETIRDLGGTSGGMVYTSGGGSRSELWMQLRANVMGRPVARTGAPESAFGAAALAASGTLHRGVTAAARAMVRVERVFEPESPQIARYDELYAAFRRECAARGLA
jgi:xylulokinase